MKSCHWLRYLESILVGGFLLWVCALPSNAGISISPSYVDLVLDQGRPAGEFLISNLGDTEERYRIQCINFKYTTDGGLLIIDDDQDSMSSWIVFNPKEFTLAPKTKRVVRFAVTPRKQLSTGEYHAAMELESLNVTTKKGDIGGGRTFNLKVFAKILVPIFGVYGTIEHTGVVQTMKLLALKEGGTAIEGLISNTGTGRLFILGQYDILDSAGKTVESGGLGKAYVLPKTDRRFVTMLKSPLPQGHYKLKMRFTSEQLSEPIVQETEVDWSPNAEK